VREAEVTTKVEERACEACGLPERVGSCSDSDGRMCNARHLWEPKGLAARWAVDDLRRERARLVKRLAEIDRLLPLMELRVKKTAPEKGA